MAHSSGGAINSRTDPFAGRSAKSYSFTAPAGSSGVFYAGGFYEAPLADANLDEGGPNIVLGTANNMYAAHAFLVAAAAGAVDAGSCSIVVSGTSVDDQGNRTPADSETIVPDITAMATDQYFETPKKWIGQILFALIPAGATVFNADFNYGFAKYDDLWNRNFKVIGFELVGLAGATDAGFKTELLFHEDTGWTYSAAAFEPGSTVLAETTDYAGEDNLTSGEPFAYKRDDLDQIVQGDDSEGFLVRITTTANNAVRILNAHVEVEG